MFKSWFITSSVSGQASARLRDLLQAVFPDCHCSDGEGALKIVLAFADDPVVPGPVSCRVAPDPESFAVGVSESTVYFAGRDLRGLSFAVEALAEHLGEGHYLSFDTKAPARVLLDPGGWSLQDRPLARRRILLNWHNFMSGCSGWNEEDWIRWIDQGRKLRFNAIMVHCYSNSPMLAAEVNGVRRPVGWLTTSVKGRDWGAQHVNDVRRIPGAESGDPLFDGPAFGSSAGLVPDDLRAEAMKTLMGRVFDHARFRGMDVVLAVDVDCQTDHPRAVLDTLPSAAKIEVRTPGGVKAFVHPEHPGGMAVYRQMIENLLEDFPQVTHLVAWFRGKTSPWGLLAHLRVSEMPAEWQSEYQQLEPGFTEAMRHSPAARPPYLFALAKIVQALRRILKEMGREDLELLCGSWDMAYLSSFHHFVDRRVPLMVLDYSLQFEHHDFEQTVRGVSGERELIPILWAHHDDHSHIGRSCVPVPRLSSRLERMGVSSFGVIHWTTRPLDLYFKNTCRQVWGATRNEGLLTTTRRMARHLFGENPGESLNDYLYLWITTSPFFGVETNQKFMSDRFKPFEDPTQQRLLARHRLSLLDATPETEALSDAGRSWLAFYRDAEEFVIRFQECFQVMQRCEEAGLEEARALLNRVSPEEVLRAYVRHIRHGETTRGELGVLVSMATRWAVYFQELRQCTGLAPVRWNFGPTQHDPLATLPGFHTFYYEPDGTVRLQLGEQETGAEIQEVPGGEELGAHGVDLSRGITLPVTGWFGRPLQVTPTRLHLVLNPSGSPFRLECRDSAGRCLASMLLEPAATLTVTVPGGTTALFLQSEHALLTHGHLETTTTPP